jgi:hypothetical protein
MNNQTTKWYSIISGTAFLLIILAFFVFVPCPTSPQLNFFRIIIALAGGAFAATIPGKFTLNKKWLTATSAIGVFALIYLVNPAGWKDDKCGLRNLKATVYIDNNLTQGVEIIVPDIGQHFFTDEFGNVNIGYSQDQIKFPTTVTFKFKSELDTSVQLTSLDDKMEFKLTTKSTGAISLEDNSFSYSYRDLTLNISLLNQIPPAELDTDSDLYAGEVSTSIIISDTLSYSFKKIDDTILIVPNSKLLSLLENNQPIRDFSGEIFAVNLPELDLKFTNNSNDAIFFNQLTVDVNKSTPINSAVFIPTSGDDDVSLINAGWGQAENVSVDFSTSSQPPSWLGSFDTHVEYSHWPSTEVKSLKEEIYRNLIQKGVDEHFLRDGEFHDGSRDTNVLRERFGDKAREFLKGAFVYGTISFEDQNKIKSTQKFESYISLGLWPGGGLEAISSKFNTELKPEGKDYQVAVPMSNSLKPKSFDRIALTLAASQSSTHVFSLIFHYDGQEYKIPIFFKLGYFFRSDMKETLKKIGGGGTSSMIMRKLPCQGLSANLDFHDVLQGIASTSRCG